MAFKLSDVGGYGTGALGDITNPSGQINSYANVTAYTASTITIGSPATGIYEKFEVGKEIAIHVSATNGTSTETTYLGAKLHCKITAVNGSVLTVDKDFTAVLPTASFANYQVQVITVAQFNKLTLSSGSVTPPAYSTTLKYGGIFLAKCADTVTFSGGSINLVDKGIPVASTAYRPKTAQETNGTADTDKYSGWENHITARQFLLNAGDGAAMIMAKHYAQTGTASRIGGTTAGVQFTRGNAGGSTIALVCGDMTGFDPSIISKTKGTGQGLGRCYIASSTKLRNDEGLYAYDCISYPSRVAGQLNIKGYGDGSLGNITNPTTCLNNYAKVTSISSDGKTISYANKTTTGIAQIASGALIMFHVSKHTDSSDMSLLARFMLAKVLMDDGNTLVLDAAVTKVFDVEKQSKYNCQIISVAQCNSLTISSVYTNTVKWDNNLKRGGICAIAIKDTLNLQDGIYLNEKGGGAAYGKEGLSFIGNAQMADVFPLGQGHGSAFVLANAVFLGAGGYIGGLNNVVGTLLGGAGTYVGEIKANGGGYVGNNSTDYSFGGGSDGGKSLLNSSLPVSGGYGSNAGSLESSNFGHQGAHLFLISDKITNFNINSIKTGGEGGYTGGGTAGYGGGGNSGGKAIGGTAGGGGGGGYNGGGGGWAFTYNGNPRIDGGGSSGWAFIYCNNYETPDYTGVVI